MLIIIIYKWNGGHWYTQDIWRPVLPVWDILVMTGITGWRGCLLMICANLQRYMSILWGHNTHIMDTQYCFYHIWPKTPIRHIILPGTHFLRWFVNRIDFYKLSPLKMTFTACTNNIYNLFIAHWRCLPFTLQVCPCLPPPHYWRNPPSVRIAWKNTGQFLILASFPRFLRK